MPANSANRKTTRQQFMAGLTTALTVTNPIVQAVYRYDAPTFAGLSPVVVGINAGLSREQRAIGTTLRWPVKYQRAEEKAVLEPAGDSASLSSAKFVRPPHNYKVFLTVFLAGSEDAVENYTVDYQD